VQIAMKKRGGKMNKNRRFVCKFHFVDWHQISFGLSIDLLSPNLEIHLPFGFIKLGWEYPLIFKNGRWQK
jgi:hypothetical protein